MIVSAVQRIMVTPWSMHCHIKQGEAVLAWSGTAGVSKSPGPSFAEDIVEAGKSRRCD
jgi:hypothetical protein